MSNLTTQTNRATLTTGITGQNGSYLAEVLLNKGYTVHRIKRLASIFNTARVDHIFLDPHIESTLVKPYYCDLSDTN